MRGRNNTNKMPIPKPIQIPAIIFFNLQNILFTSYNIVLYEFNLCEQKIIKGKNKSIVNMKFV